MVAMVLLLLPIVALYRLSAPGNSNSAINSVAMIMVCTLLFASMITLFTQAKRHELFMMVVAYVAVLCAIIEATDLQDGLQSVTAGINSTSCSP